MSDWSLARALAAFVAVLRADGIAVSPAESADALAALRRVPLTDERRFAAALRACLAKTPEDQARFDAAFHAFWHVGFTDPADVVDDDPEAPPDESGRDASPGGDTTPTPVVAPESTAQQEAGPSQGASAQARRMRADLAASDDEREALEAMIRELGRRLASRAARRWRRRRRGVLDMRASLRRAIARGGEVFELKRRLRPRERPRLVVFADVSYSMDAYSRFFLCFIHAFARAFKSVESFVFSTRLSRVTDALARGRLEQALSALPETVDDWAGGTRIGDSLTHYMTRYADAQLDRNTIVMIVSDGWDSGERATLDDALARLHSRCRALIWLDPLMDHPRYFSTALGAQHESRHVDMCAPARNLEALAGLADRLSRERIV